MQALKVSLAAVASRNLFSGKLQFKLSFLIAVLIQVLAVKVPIFSLVIGVEHKLPLKPCPCPVPATQVFIRATFDKQRFVTGSRLLPLLFKDWLTM